jgi:hypothetical protein
MASPTWLVTACAWGLAFAGCATPLTPTPTRTRSTGGDRAPVSREVAVCYDDSDCDDMCDAGGVCQDDGTCDCGDSDGGGEGGGGDQTPPPLTQCLNRVHAGENVGWDLVRQACVDPATCYSSPCTPIAPYFTDETYRDPGATPPLECFFVFTVEITCPDGALGASHDHDSAFVPSPNNPAACASLDEAQPGYSQDEDTPKMQGPQYCVYGV